MIYEGSSLTSLPNSLNGVKEIILLIKLYSISIKPFPIEITVCSVMLEIESLSRL
jgi:hypothetical protein